MPVNLKKQNDISQLIKELLHIAGAGDTDMDNNISRITKNYDQLCSSKETYINFINNEEKIRVLAKKELFNEGRLKINLSKFSGYKSELDLYTFQSEFMKLNARSTPKGLLADELMNNFLEGKALALVSSLDKVDDIWERLKSAYGDAKLLLKRKIGEVDRIAYLWKIRGPEKVAEMLSKLINVMKDLMKLATEHDIEARLYSGLERIYNLLGDSRLTRWLSQITEKKLSDKQLWSGLIIFLESDLKVQQQRCFSKTSLII